MYSAIHRAVSGSGSLRRSKKPATCRPASLRADVVRGEYRTATKTTLNDYAATWIESYGGRTRGGLREETREDYRRRLEQDVLPVLGRMRLSEIEPRHVKQLAAEIGSRAPACRSCKGTGTRGEARRRCPKCEGTGHLAGQVSPSTVRLALAPLKALLATAHAEGDIRTNPTLGLRLAQTQPLGDLEDADVRR